MLQNAMQFAMSLFNAAAATDDADEADALTEDAGATGPSGVNDDDDDAEPVLPAL